MWKNDISWNVHQTVKGNHKLLLDEDMGMKDMTEMLGKAYQLRKESRGMKRVRSL